MEALHSPNDFPADFPSSPSQILEAVVDRFAQWRTTRKKIERIPESLWQAAASLHPRYSVHQIARALRLDFVDIRNRILPDHRHRRRSPRQPAPPAGVLAESAPFLELPPVPAPAAGPSECILKLKEGPQGTRLTIRLKGVGTMGPLLEVLRGL